jgi:hypothetical protein
MANVSRTEARPSTVKGVASKLRFTPRPETVIALTCHCALSELCKAQKDGSAAPRGLDARHRLVGPTGRVRVRVRVRVRAPEPLVIWAQLHAAGSNLGVCLHAGPELLGIVTVKDARRSVTGPLSAASARYLRMLAILTLGR